MLEADGTVVAGPKEVTGLISRRTELRDLRREELVLSEQLAAGDSEIARLRDNIEERLAGIRRTTDRHKDLSGQLADQHVARARCRISWPRCSRKSMRRAENARRPNRRSTRWPASGIKRGRGSRQSRPARPSWKSRSASGKRNWPTPNGSFVNASAATAMRVDVAKREQRLDGLRRQLSQFEADRRERARAVADAQGEIADAARRRHEAERRSWPPRPTPPCCTWPRIHSPPRSCASTNSIACCSRSGPNWASSSGVNSALVAQLRERLHQCELAAGEVRHERNTLADRLREEYGLDIARLHEERDEEQQQHCEAIEQEIAALKRKISNIGAVNMEALDELDDLETRFASLDGQFQDLTQAKQALERIIHKINTDSRRLFSETLEAIRDNFQHLYRKAFGGGKADLILEEGMDLLECGIDILATPPGKPSFSNSLLSGGEKALTAVALLLAIFQYRPSPFCVLDEVDAPFDEANISRFIEMLKEFLGWTKFVLVTHSKKTMTAATTLYGVTMQESGVSKQVSVRFEDVSEDGHISEEAVRRTREAAGAADGERAA